MRLQTGSSANDGISLNFNKGTNEAIIFDFAPIKVGWTYDGYILAKFDIEDANVFKFLRISSH